MGIKQCKYLPLINVMFIFIWVAYVRIYDFKLEGSELFKESFRNLFCLEWKYFKKTLIKKSVFQNIKQKAQN